MNDFFSRLIEFMSLWGGNEIFGRLGGSLFGWDLKIWEKPVGGGEGRDTSKFMYEINKD